MTYCLTIAIKNGLVFASDSRNNAGVDDISPYGKSWDRSLKEAFKSVPPIASGPTSGQEAADDVD